MILQDYIDEVKLRLNRYNVVVDSNDLLLITYINDGRRNAQRLSLPYVGQRYGRIITIQGTAFTLFNPTSIALPNSNVVSTYNAPLPADCIDIDTVICGYTNGATSFRKEARRMDKEEVYNLSLNNWTIPTIDRPAFTLEHILFSNTPIGGRSLLIAGINQADIVNMNMAIWYKAVIPELNDPGEQELWLSPDYQELSIYYAMLSLVRDSKSQEHYQTVAMVLNKMVGNLTGVYQMNQFQPIKELETNEAK